MVHAGDPWCQSGSAWFLLLGRPCHLRKPTTQMRCQDQEKACCVEVMRVKGWLVSWCIGAVFIKHPWQRSLVVGALRISEDWRLDAEVDAAEGQQHLAGISLSTTKVPLIKGEG